MITTTQASTITSLLTHRAAATTPILALHGSASNPGQWQALVESFRGEREVIAPCLPGYDADELKSLSGALGLDSRLTSIRERLVNAGRPVHIIGHSFGGALALRLGELHPQLVLSISVYEPTALAVLRRGSKNIDLSLLDEFKRLALITANAGAEVAMESFINYWMGGNYWQSLAEPVKRGLISVADVVARDFQDGLAEVATDAGSQRYQGPVQILTGGDTIAAARRIAELLAAELPAADWQRLPGLGHMGPLSDSAVVNGSYRQFLRSVEVDKRRISA
jgi:pimeloyl-ACP methyl ester carboxylesterase